MNISLKPVVTLLLLAVYVHCFAQELVKPADKNITYMGRVNISRDSACFYWPGSSATINFIGKGVTIKMRSLKEPGFFYAIVDGNAEKAYKFGSDSVLRTFTLADGLSSGKHSLQLYKLSNNTSANIFYGFQIEGNGKVLKGPELPRRKIEFYGNSITVGHGVDRPQGVPDSGLPQYFNNYYTYDAITARHFNAQFSCIARSGIGIMLSWFPEIMPEVYDRLDPMDPNSKWDFSKYQPDVVVINLFQNDSWLVNLPKHPQFKARFGTTKPDDGFIITAYQNFVTSIRAKYPKTNIICALGNMDATYTGSKWPGYIEQAVANMKDDKIHCVFFPYKNTPGHPTRAEQQAMADSLISFIDKYIKW